MPSLNSITYDQTQFNIQQQAQSESLLVHSQSYTVKYNATSEMWVDANNNGRNIIFLDGGFRFEITTNGNQKNILFMQMKIDSNVYNSLPRYSHYHIRITLMRGTTGYDCPFAAGSTWCTSLAADRVNSYIYRCDNLTTYKIPIKIENLTEQQDWHQIITLIEIYGPKPTLKDGQ